MFVQQIDLIHPRNSTPTSAIRDAKRLRRSRRMAILFGCLVAMALTLGPSAIAPPAATAVALPAARTVVSLTFDDGFASVQAARREMLQRNMRGTFYISSGLLGQPGRLTWDEIRAMEAEGHEIGGHTVNHAHLETLDEAEQARQICDDRVALTNQGLRVTSFAYPFGASGPTTAATIRNCGYSSARAVGSLMSGCPQTCPAAESVPPKDLYSIRTAGPVISSTSVESIKEQITQAENQGQGWIPVVFHEVCDGNCSDMAISPAHFAELLDWLQTRATHGTVVETVAQVVGGDMKPAVAGPIDPRPAGQLVNPSLETPGISNDVSPALDPSQCWERAGYGDNAAEWSRVRSGRSGSWAEQVTVTAYSSGDQKLIYREDSGSCSPAVIPGQSYVLGAWYNSSAPTRIVAYYRSQNGAWTFWAGSPQEPSSADWRHITWQTPPAPADATRVSFGLQLASVGTLTMDDYTMSAADVSKAAAPTPLAGLQNTLITGGLVALIALPTLAFVLALAIWARRRERHKPLHN
jgi:peptidoglycan/xylan/chitin deacetylase (PgdA/CDA1 family)